MKNPPDFTLIANPTAGISAGRGNRTRLIEAARHDLERHKFSVEVWLESDPLKLRDLAEEKARAGHTKIIATGGDGTANAVVNGIMRAAQDDETLLERITFGVLPLGTGNVFAFNLGIGKTWREGCKVLRAGHTRRIDVGIARPIAAKSKVQGSKPNAQGSKSKVPALPVSAFETPLEARYFLLMAGIGFDARVIEETSLRLKFVLRDFAYVLKTLQNVVLHQGAQTTLRFCDGRVYANEAWLIMVGNAASYAWDIKVTSNAELDDGVLDVCVMPFENKFVSIQQAMQILTGQHIERGIAHYWKTECVQIESEPPVPVQLDGDEWGYTPVEIGIRPGALRVLAPPETVPKTIEALAPES